MAEDKTYDRTPDGQDTVMVFFNPELLQSMADLSAEKQQNLREIRIAAEEGDLDAAYQLGQRYCQGTGGVQKDEAQGFYWFQKAADGDHIAAQYSLAICHLRGVGTEEDQEKAVSLLSSAADQGYPPAVCELGLCYELGMGVEMDKQRAAELYREAAEHDFAQIKFYAYSTTGK